MPDADLVLEGGRVKGLGTAGAVLGLLDAGWTFPRVTGTSVGALAAAFAAAGADARTFRDVLGRLDLRRIPDRRAPLPVVRLLEHVVATALVGRDQTHLDRPEVRERTMTVDTSGTAITEFDIGEREKAALVERGRTAARGFLHGWEGRTG